MNQDILIHPYGLDFMSCIHKIIHTDMCTDLRDIYMYICTHVYTNTHIHIYIKYTDICKNVYVYKHT